MRLIADSISPVSGIYDMVATYETGARLVAAMIISQVE